ncbi:MAG: type I 3-dehydroquinate dehydratase [Gammaproteobacteria bacterium]|nr:type I 3-dehydroquinate dehydratase [Gammaproteobacteria bacterium]
MTGFRPLLVRGTPLGNGVDPAVCLPLLASDSGALETEIRGLVALQPDIIEWRADYFDGRGSTDSILSAAARLRAAAGEMPLIFTLRSKGEGGATGGYEPSEATGLLEQVARSRILEFVDVELSLPSLCVKTVIDAARESGVQVILSSHHFGGTPSDTEMMSVLCRAAAMGADVAKLAVIPKSVSDVVALLAVTERAHRELSLPLVTMAMGPLGVVTRVFGGTFGSAMTFAVGSRGSASGQLPLKALREIFDSLRQLEK